MYNRPVLSRTRQVTSHKTKEKEKGMFWGGMTVVPVFLKLTSHQREKKKRCFVSQTRGKRRGVWGFMTDVPTVLFKQCLHYPPGLLLHSDREQMEVGQIEVRRREGEMERERGGGEKERERCNSNLPPKKITPCGRCEKICEKGFLNTFLSVGEAAMERA